MMWCARGVPALWMAVALTGCQSPRAIAPPVPDVAPLRQERRDAAIQEFEEKRTQAQYESALSQRELGDTAGCMEQLETLIERVPDFAPGRLLLAECLLELDQTEAALEHVEAVLQADANDPRGQQLAAEIAARMSETGSSAGVEPAGYEAHTGRSELVDGQAAAALAEGKRQLDRGDADGAKAAFQRAIDAAPRDVRVVIAVAVASLRSGQTALARDFLEAARGTYPAEARLFQTLGLVYYRRGEYAAAESALRQALSLDKTSGLSYFLMGSTLAKSGDQAGAATHFHEAARRDRAFAGPH